MGKSTLILGILLMGASLSSCGGGVSGQPMLQSIAISPSSPTSSAQFVATGTFSDGSKVSPLPVSWFIIEVPDIDPAPGYNLTPAPFSQQCSTGQSGAFLVTAFAPANPKAPPTGAMPENVWAAMIGATMQSEGGFVGGSAHLNCP